MGCNVFLNGKGSRITTHRDQIHQPQIRGTHLRHIGNSLQLFLTKMRQLCQLLTKLGSVCLHREVGNCFVNLFYILRCHRLSQHKIADHRSFFYDGCHALGKSHMAGISTSPLIGLCFIKAIAVTGKAPCFQFRQLPHTAAKSNHFPWVLTNDPPLFIEQCALNLRGQIQILHHLTQFFRLFRYQVHRLHSFSILVKCIQVNFLTIYPILQSNRLLSFSLPMLLWNKGAWFYVVPKGLQTASLRYAH